MTGNVLMLSDLIAIKYKISSMLGNDVLYILILMMESHNLNFKLKIFYIYNNYNVWYRYTVNPLVCENFIFLQSIRNDIALFTWKFAFLWVIVYSMNCR